jgi:hypothetical protein
MKNKLIADIVAVTLKPEHLKFNLKIIGVALILSLIIKKR